MEVRYNLHVCTTQYTVQFLAPTDTTITPEMWQRHPGTDAFGVREGPFGDGSGRHTHAKQPRRHPSIHFVFAKIELAR